MNQMSMISAMNADISSLGSFLGAGQASAEAAGNFEAVLLGASVESSEDFAAAGFAPNVPALAENAGNQNADLSAEMEGSPLTPEQNIFQFYMQNREEESDVMVQLKAILGDEAGVDAFKRIVSLLEKGSLSVHKDMDDLSVEDFEDLSKSLLERLDLAIKQISAILGNGGEQSIETEEMPQQLSSNLNMDEDVSLGNEEYEETDFNREIILNLLGDLLKTGLVTARGFEQITQNAEEDEFVVPLLKELKGETEKLLSALASKGEALGKNYAAKQDGIDLAAVSNTIIDSKSNEDDEDILAFFEEIMKDSGLKAVDGESAKAEDKSLEDLEILETPLAKKEPELKQENNFAKSEEIEKPETKSFETKAPEAKDIETKTAETKTAETKSSEFAGIEIKSDETKKTEAISAETKSFETKAPEAKNFEAKTAETKTAEIKSSEAIGSEMKTAEAKETKPRRTEARIPETKIPEARGFEARSAETKSADIKGAEMKNAEMKSPERNFDMKNFEARISETKGFETASAETKGVEIKAQKVEPEVRAVWEGGDLRIETVNPKTGEKLQSIPMSSTHRMQERINEFEVVRQVVAQARFITTPTGEQKMTMQLRPEHLGQVDLRITLSHGEMQIQARVESAPAQAALENHIGLLREGLEKQGITLDRLEVSVEQRENRDAYLAHEREEQRNGRNGKHKRGKASHLAVSIAKDESSDTGRRLGYNTMEYLA